MRKTGMFVIAGLLLAANAQAAPACQEPAAVARAFFEATSGDNGFVLDAPQALVSDGFGKALRGERACQAREQGICNIDWDPWLDAQDADIEGPVTYQWKGASADTGTVEIHYAVEKQAFVSRVPMVRQRKGCWQADDLISNNGRSLRRILARPVP